VSARRDTRRLLADVPADLDEAAALLLAGKLVAFPTETVYGLGADGLRPEAVGRIFAAKGRPADNPLILHVASFDQAQTLWAANDDQRALARALADRFWPGPLTLVLPAADVVPSVVTAGLPTVAVRAPDHDVAQALIARCGRPLAAPSANRSGRPSPTSAEHVVRTLDGRIDAVLDGGPTAVGVESTVLDLSRERPQVLRPGDVSAAMLKDALQPLGVALEEGAVPDDAASPGIRHRHYAPRSLAVSIVDAEALAGAWASSAAVLCRKSTADRLGPRDAPTEVLPDDERGFARELYAALYRLEQSGAKVLLIEQVPRSSSWGAVADRLRRAAGDA
jgi:L-threonylcarbamoyladenylate synthase